MLQLSILIDNCNISSKMARNSDICRPIKSPDYILFTVLHLPPISQHPSMPLNCSCVCYLIQISWENYIDCHTLYLVSYGCETWYLDYHHLNVIWSNSPRHIGLFTCICCWRKNVSCMYGRRTSC